MEHVRIHITGIVQGVGFRPFVYREAVAAGVTGWVLNAADGVHIEAHAERDALKRFVRSLREHAPAAARIDKIEIEALDETGCAHNQGDGLSDGHDASLREFCIIASDDSGARTTLVSPDIATCPDCLRELFDPTDRRYRYPFINCTNCGPRYTIIRALPYDRRNTSMDAFPMCPQCAAEYDDPLDRRFHAQPDACFACGPHLTWRERTMPADADHSTLTGKVLSVGESDGSILVGRTRAESDAIIARAAALIGRGGILALKGLGGFHLACDAGNAKAVAELRHRKRRSNKPLAVMVADLSDAEQPCHVGDVERELLAGTVRPIVLLRRRADADGPAPADKPQPAGVPDATGAPSRTAIAPNVAGDLPELGIMLPYTPLQHLLMADCRAAGVRALVMTSGNVSEEPIECDDALAWRHLVENGIADALLGNDRAILSRFDDSVVRVVDGCTQVVRRARGYAPRPIALPAPAWPNAGRGAATGFPAILACGPEQKATLALVREGENGAAECFVSQHIGDLENAETFDAWQETRRRMEDLFGIEPAAIACDRHPGYLSSQWARAEAAAKGLPLVEVQHHHAHIASVIAEAAARGEVAPDVPVVGIALDGTGAGDDGSVWGGEVLIATLARCERVAHLRCWRLPGGAASVRDARRNALSLLLEYDLLDHPGARRLLAGMTEQERTLTRQMAERGINSPLTSSMGRFLDAVAALLGICERATYEGEPAIELEAAAARWLGARRADRQAQALTGPASRANSSGAEQESGGVIDLADLLRTLLDGVAADADPGEFAWRAHAGVARIVVERALAIARCREIRIAALSGGCFMNRLLLEQVKGALEQAGMTVLLPRELPVNDGCIAYGQAAVARAQLVR